MHSAVSLCLGQAQAIRQAVRSWHPDAAPTESLYLTTEAMRDTAVRMGLLAARVMQEAWQDLDEGRLSDPRRTGAALDDLLGSVAESLHTLKGFAAELRAARLQVPDMSVLDRTRSELTREIERFREGWPLGVSDERPEPEPEEDAGVVYELGAGD